MKHILHISVFLILAFQTSLVLASPDMAPLVYAGFAFSGDFNNREQLYPFSAQISSEDRGLFLDKILREKLLARAELASKVSLELADGKRDLSAMAFSLVQENIETQMVDGKCWVIVTLQANVLVFNMVSKSIVASYPLRMRFTSVRDTSPTDHEKKELIRAAYTSCNKNENIFDQWLDRFGQADIHEAKRKYLRVTGVEISPEAKKVIIDAGKSVSSIQNQVANFLEVAIAQKSGIPVVPNSVGEAIGNKMAYRFSNGSELQLILPDPDFSLSFVIRDFVSKRLDKTEYFQDIFRVKGKITLKQPDLAKTILDENVYNTLIVTCPKQADVQLSEWDQYFKTLQSLVFMVGKQITQVEDDWLNDHASQTMDAKQGFIDSKKVLQEML